MFYLSLLPFSRIAISRSQSRQITRPLGKSVFTRPCSVISTEVIVKMLHWSFVRGEGRGECKGLNLILLIVHNVPIAGIDKKHRSDLQHLVNLHKPVSSPWKQGMGPICIFIIDWCWRLFVCYFRLCKPLAYLHNIWLGRYLLLI